MRFVLLGLALAANGCSPGDGVAGTGERRGYVRVAFELNGFQLCGSSELWWFDYNGATAGRDLLESAIAGCSAREPCAPFYVEVTATVSEEGAFGHLGQFPRMISFTAIHEVSSEQPEDCPRAGQFAAP